MCCSDPHTNTSVDFASGNKGRVLIGAVRTEESDDEAPGPGQSMEGKSWGSYSGLMDDVESLQKLVKKIDVLKADLK